MPCQMNWNHWKIPVTMKNTNYENELKKAYKIFTYVKLVEFTEL